jgi:hypothetical protein
VADSLSVFSKSMRERLLRPERISSPRRIPKHIAGDRSFVFGADAHALRKRLPPKQGVRVGGNSKQGDRLESHFPIVSELPTTHPESWLLVFLL